MLQHTVYFTVMHGKWSSVLKIQIQRYWDTPNETLTGGWLSEASLLLLQEIEIETLPQSAPATVNDALMSLHLPLLHLQSAPSSSSHSLSHSSQSSDARAHALSSVATVCCTLWSRVCCGVSRSRGDERSVAESSCRDFYGCQECGATNWRSPDRRQRERVTENLDTLLERPHNNLKGI